MNGKLRGFTVLYCTVLYKQEKDIAWAVILSWLNKYNIWASNTSLELIQSKLGHSIATIYHIISLNTHPSC